MNLKRKMAFALSALALVLSGPAAHAATAVNGVDTASGAPSSNVATSDIPSLGGQLLTDDGGNVLINQEVPGLDQAIIDKWDGYVSYQTSTATWTFTPPVAPTCPKNGTRGCTGTTTSADEQQIVRNAVAYANAHWGQSAKDQAISGAQSLAVRHM